MKPVLYLLIIASMFAITSCSPSSQIKSPSKPNIVLIFIDDEGYGDLGSYGATGYVTPNIDKLAAGGMRFTNYYAAQPICSASRAGLLTGCYPNRIGITGALFPNSKIGINANEMTIAEMLKPLGYATMAIGKWHLGDAKQFLPLQNGFDEFFGLPYSNDMWPVKLNDSIAKPGEYQSRFPPLPLIEGNKKIEEINSHAAMDQITTRYTEKAVDFINRNKNKPFFLYLAHTMGHVPLGVSDKFRGKTEQGMYGDVMEELDWSVGQVVKTLEDDGIEKNTIIIYASDNGPWLNYGNHAGSAGGLREGKSTSWEGGQRVPLIIRWAGHVKEGIVCNKLACAIDIMPTLAEITGAKLSDNKIDGVSILELLKGNFAAEPRKELYYYFGTNNLDAVRKGNWKLVLPHTYDSYHMPPGHDGIGGLRKRMRVESPELYNMRRDPGEQYNVIDQYPDIAADLQKLADSARAELGDLNVGIPKGRGNREPGRIE